MRPYYIIYEDSAYFKFSEHVSKADEELINYMLNNKNKGWNFYSPFDDWIRFDLKGEEGIFIHTWIKKGEEGEDGHKTVDEIKEDIDNKARLLYEWLNQKNDQLRLIEYSHSTQLKTINN